LIGEVRWPQAGQICYGVFSGMRLEAAATGEVEMNRESRIFCLMVAVALSFMMNPADGQETTTPSQDAPPTSSQAAPANGPAPATNAATQAKAAFDRNFREYKGIVREIERLQAEFQTVDPAEREGINAAMTGQIAHAQAVINEMVEAGVEAYRFAPNADPQVREFLEAVVRYYVAGRQVRGASEQIDGGDQYERALPIIKALVEGGAESRELLLWEFLSAFVTNDYDLAEKYLKRAQEMPPTESEDARSDAAKEATMQLVAKFAPMLEQYRQWWAAEAKLRAAEAQADDLPRVKLTTTKGEITLELFENEAPQTVANIITLVKQRHYDGSPFHRVIAKFMAQGGAKNDDGSGRLGYTIRGEAGRPDFRRHFRGSLSMGLLPGRPDSGGAQFFLTTVPTPHLDGEHTVFGRVIEGIEVLADLTRREPTDDPQQDAALPEPDRILKAEVLRDRGHAYSFEKLPEP
jgi:cyclophilin family peptidyl-prolyl cis-trans isomerase